VAISFAAPPVRVGDKLLGWIMQMVMIAPGGYIGGRILERWPKFWAGAAVDERFCGAWHRCGCPACGANTSCLEDAYRQRILQLLAMWRRAME
jgi:hypothetical protein